MGLKIAREVKAISDELSVDYIFKASYKKIGLKTIVSQELEMLMHYKLYKLLEVN